MELVCGLGEALVGNWPGSALRFTVAKAALPPLSMDQVRHSRACEHLAGRMQVPVIQAPGPHQNVLLSAGQLRAVAGSVTAIPSPLL